MQTSDALKPIKTETDYEAAMELVKNLWNVEPGTPEASQLEVLGIMIDQYEAQQYPSVGPCAVINIC